LNSNGTQGWDENGDPKTGDDTYSFNLNGVSSALYLDPATGRYRSANENFYKFEYDVPNQTWTIWDKSGTQYIFSHLTNNFVWHPGECAYLQLPWRWSLTTVRNTFGQEIEYTYAAETKDFAYFDCEGHPHIKTSETWVYPESIEYAQDNNGHNRYRIFFDRIEETETLKYPRKDLKVSWSQPLTYEAFQRSLLEAIRIEQDSNGDGTFETLIRKYKFTYCQAAACSIFPRLVWEKGGRTPTLISMQEFGVGGTQSLPANTFIYGDKMHLTSASNGYGATMTYQYNNSTNALAPQNAWHDVEGGNPLKYDSSLTGWEGCVAPHYENGMISGADVCGLAQNTQVDSYQPGRWYEIKARVQSSVQGTTPTVQLGYAYKENGVLSPDYLDPGVTLPSNRAWRVVQSQPFFLPVNATQIIPKIKSSNGFTHVSWYYLVPLPTYSRVTSRTISTTGATSYTYTYDYTGAATNSPAISVAAAGERPYIEPYTEFRGHSQVTVTDPYGAQTITEFKQDDIFNGRVEAVTVKDGSGITMQASTTEYDYQQWPAAARILEKCDVVTECGQPYDQLYIRWVKTVSETKTVPGAVSGSLTTIYDYNDNNGNLISQTVSGSIPNELITHYQYYSNTSGGKYIVGLPRRIWVTTGGNTLAESIHIYGSVNSSNSDAIGLQKTRTLMTSGGQYSQVSYGYDNWGNVTSATTWSGYGTDATDPTEGERTMTTVYDSAYHTYPIGMTTPPVDGFPSGLTTTLTYNYTLSVPTSETGPNGAATTAEYDVFGRLTKLIRPGDISASPTLSIAYTNSNPFTVTLTQKINDTQNFTIARRYDGLGRPTLVTTNGTTFVSYVYGYGGNVHEDRQSMPYTTTATDWTKILNDSLKRPQTVIAPDGTTTNYAYDGLKTTVYDANGNPTSTTSDILGHTRLVDAPTGPDIAFGYDDLGRLKTAERGGTQGTEVVMNYDLAGRKISMDDPDMGDWIYSYDALGNLKTQTDARGCVTSLQYDNLNRLTNKSYSNCPGNVENTSSVQYFYDGQQFTFDNTTYSSSSFAIGQRTGMVAGSTASAWTYDERGRLISETKDFADSSSFTTEWTLYNSADLPVIMKYPDGEFVTTNYDNRMLPISVAGNANYVSSMGYDSAGRMTSRALGNGLTQKYLYKPWNEQGGRLDMMVAGTGTWDETNLNFATTLQKSDYTYDSVGNITTIADSMWGETQNFGYDSLNRLTSASATDGLAVTARHTNTIPRPATS
jgi:YD repeat-containing protein